MLTKEELNDKYIKYILEINEEIFNKVIDKLESLGFVHGHNFSREEEYSFFTTRYPYLRISNKKWKITKSNVECEEIQVSDILDKNWSKFEVGEWYKLDDWVSKFKRLHAGYKFWGENINTKTGFIDDEGWLDLKFYKPVKLSIEEVQQYLPEGHANKIKKWSVGSYIVPLQDRLLTRIEPLTKGKPYEIIKYDYVPYILDNNDSKINFVNRDNPEEKEGIRWFPTLKEAEAFSEELLEIDSSEIDETFKEGTLIKGEFYNLPGYAIFEAGKKGYIGSGGRDWRAICDNNWAGPENFVPATPLEKKWVITCRKQNKFIEKSELNKYDDEGNLIEMKQCVITTTQEEWDFCLSKCDQSSRLSKCNDKFKQWSKHYPEGIAVCIENNSYCGINWFKNNGYEVIPFQEFLDSNGYTLEKETIKFKPGDKIVGVSTTGLIIHSSEHSSVNDLGVPGKYFIPDEVEYNEDDTIKLWSNGTYWGCFLKDISLYKEEEENMKKRYVKYNETFTEDMFNYMLYWAKKQNFPGKPYTMFDNTFDSFKIKEHFWFNCHPDYCYGVDNNPQTCTEITFKELFPEYKLGEMQLSDLKNPVFNIGDKVRVIADSFNPCNEYCLELVEPAKKEFDRKWYVEVNNQEEADLVFNWLREQGEPVINEDGYLNFRVGIDKCINYWKEENTWFVNNQPERNTYQKQLSDIIPNYSSGSKINRNVYYEVNNQKEYHEILSWLKTIGEPVTSNYLVAMGDWRYIIFNGSRWILSNNHVSRVKEEYYFKNDSPPVQVIHYEPIINKKHEVKIINVPKI